MRAGVWERRGDAAGPVVLDIDSTLVEARSENKQQAAAHFKGGFGFHPMLCATDEGEPLSIKLRAGNAAANHILDHIEVLDAAIAQLPAAVAGGHREGDEAPPRREVHLRVDAAGCSVRIAEVCRARDVGFFMTARSNHQVEAAIDHNRFDADKWQPALVRWFQQLQLTGPLAQAAPKRLRQQLWHAPARLVRSSRKWTLHLLDWRPTNPPPPQA